MHRLLLIKSWAFVRGTIYRDFQSLITISCLYRGTQTNCSLNLFRRQLNKQLRLTVFDEEKGALNPIPANPEVNALIEKAIVSPCTNQLKV